MEGSIRLEVDVGLQSQAGPGTTVGKEVAWGKHPSENQHRKRLLREVGSICFKHAV